MSTLRTVRTLAKSAFNRVVNRSLRCFGTVRLEKLGSDDGGWWVPVEQIQADWVCYLGGAGVDITFDTELIRRFGCTVFTFDPTPRAIAHVARVAGSNAQLRFQAYGLWSENAELRFYAPKDPTHVSHSVVNRQHTEEFFLALVKPIGDVMRSLGHDRIDLFKLDIEGAEWRVLRTLEEAKVFPKVICAEFDRPRKVGETLQVVNWLHKNYRLVRVDGKNVTFIRRPRR